MFFSQFGNILEIHANKRLATRGQAWIVFASLASATKALREMQGFNFYGKPMRVAYARAKSDVIAKIDGTFVPRKKRVPEAIKPAKAPKRKKVEAVKIQAEPAAPAPSREEEAEPAGPVVIQASANSAPARPNKILFVENLPPQCNAMMLAMLFQQYSGYKEARLVPGKAGIAFVEFEDIFQATQAKESLQNFKITPTHLMKINFAKQ